MFAGTNFIEIEVGDFHLFIGRILTFTIPLLIIRKEQINKLFQTKHGKLLFFILALMLAWSLLSLYWAPDRRAVIINSFYIVSGIFNGLVLITLGFDENYKVNKQFIKGWFVTWIGLVIFAYAEILLNFHIKGNFSEFLQNQIPGIPAFDFVISLFGGPNEFAMYLVISLPFAIYFLNSKPFYLICVLVITFQFIYRNDAKFCLIAYIFFIISLFLVFKTKIWNSMIPHVKKYYKYTLLIIGFFTIVVLSNQLVINKSDNYSIYSSFESNIIEIQKNSGVIANGTNKTQINKDNSAHPNHIATQSISSFSIRWNLYLNGYKILLERPMIGVGAGNFEYYMLNLPDLLTTNSIVNSHSWLIQTISENGIVVGGFYWTIVILLFFNNLKFYFKNNGNNLQKFLSINLLLIFGIISNVSSSFASSPLNWSIFCFILIAFEGNTKDK